MLGIPLRIVPRGTGVRQVRTFHAAGAPGSQRSAPAVDPVAGQTVVSRDQPLAFFQTFLLRHLHVRVARSTAGLGILQRDHRMRPVRHVAVGIGHLRRPSLPAMTDRTTELARVMHHIRMRSRRQGGPSTTGSSPGAMPTWHETQRSVTFNRATPPAGAVCRWGLRCCSRPPGCAASPSGKFSCTAAAISNTSVPKLDQSSRCLFRFIVDPI
jgi:hypothetical protein